MPRFNYPYKSPSKGAFRMRVHRLLKRTKAEQNERLRLEGDASTSYSTMVPTQHAEPAVTEVAEDEGDQTVPYADRPQSGASQQTAIPPLRYPPPLLHASQARACQHTAIPRLRYPPPLLHASQTRASQKRAIPRLQSRSRLIHPSQTLATLLPKIHRIQSTRGNQIPVCDTPVQSVSEDSNPITLLEIYKALMNLTQKSRRIATVVTRVHDICKEIKRSLDTQYASTKAVREPPAAFHAVPAYTMEQVIALDSRLSDNTYYSQLSDYCLRIGGGDLRTLVRNILSRLISPAMSEDVHCTGKSRPFIFKNSRLHGFVLDQVSKRAAFSGVEPKAVAYEARLWFRLRREQNRGKAHGVVMRELGTEDYQSGKENESIEECEYLGWSRK
ncbi:unnamed protein product [Calicophoron daubneyi]|uniref:Uncharacterized protein n=1 Tax=Calicophoron daubneyi TaxID=300641 RepID=A0AAV2SZM2_CALDB